ncbi:potassium voltage gated channel subfamily H [Echinococcus multilocularis]|uniref:Potassium voltage gated channel subfamily H n=1 Tax=Echinococcus multilocularis TaxID=6211 RepID=A0A068Y2K5_ECHMU|nr:potassium voltage gated channel subfamily H [Echinococcus multilocularis]
MPVRRGHIAPKNTYIDTLIKKFDNQYAAFVITNSKIALHPIIYCSADFCDLFCFTKAQLLLKSSNFPFLCGEKTSSESIQALANGLVCDRETKLQLSLYTRKDEVKQCEVTITPLTDEFGRVSLHIIFFEAVEGTHLEKRQTRCASARRISSIATMIFHRGKEPPRNNLKRIHQMSQSVRHELLPKEVVLSRRPSENIPAGNNHKISISSLFINDLKSPSEPANTEKSARFDSISVETANSVTLRSSVQTSRASMANEPIKKSEVRPKSCSNAPPLWSDHQSSETESTTDRARPASAVLGGRCSRYALPSLLARGSRLISAPASQTSIVLSDAGTLQVVLGKHGDQAKSHVTDTFAKILSLDKDLHEKRKLESKRMHKYTIKHYSPIRAVWDWFILLLVIYTVIFTPYMTAFLLNYKGFNCTHPHRRSPGHRTILGTVDIMVDIMFVCDIIINFRTTYVNKNDEVVSNPKKIATHYLKGWFFIDLVAAIPFDALFFRSQEKQPTALIGLLKSARLLRLINVARKLDRYSEYGTAILVLLTSVFVLIAHWLACIWYAIGNAEHQHSSTKIGWLATLAEQTRQFYNESPCSGPTLQTKYITALYFTFSSLTSIGFGNVSPNTNAEKIFSIVVMLVGSLMYASIFGNVSAIIQRLYSGTARYHAQMLRIKEFIRFHQIPGPLRQRLEEYFIHAWAYTYGIDMSVVQRSFPECLQSDICMHVYKTMLKTTRAFEGLTEGCLRTFALRIRTVHLPPGDTLIHAGGLLTCLYFVEQGSLEVLDPQDGAILAVLSKGDFFGGLPPLQEQPQNSLSTMAHGLIAAKSRFIVRALTYCDLHYVEQEELAGLLHNYPELIGNLVAHFELTMPLAGIGKYLTEADLFCLSRDQKQQQQQDQQQLHSPHGGTSPVCLHKTTSSSCVFTETPLLQVPPRAQMQSRARLPDTWLGDCRRRKLCSWELERLQRLLEHSATAMVADSASAPNIDGDGGGGIDSSTSSTATTTTTASPPPSHMDLEERLSAQMAQRFNKMEMNLLELEEKMTTTFVSLLSHLQCLQTPLRPGVNASTMTEMEESGDEEEIEVNVRVIEASNGNDL